MEERVPPPDDPPLTPSPSSSKPTLPQSPRPTITTTGENHNEIQDEQPQQPLPLPPRLATYVVQIPKDQIYRVPPPENARIVDSYQKPAGEKKRGKKCLLFGFVGLLILSLIIGLAVLVIHLIFNPKSPNFSVTNVHFKINNSSKPNSRGFDVNLRSDNMNERMAVDYESGGESSLSFKTRVIAKGNVPSFLQEAKNLTVVRLVLTSSKMDSLPPEIGKSINETKGKTPMALGMTVTVPVKFRSWLRTVKKDMTITCDFKVNTLGKDSKVLSQECKSEM